MSQLQYNEIREKKIIIYADEPCEVIGLSRCSYSTKKTPKSSEIKKFNFW